MDYKLALEIVGLCLLSMIAGYVLGFTNGWHLGGQDCKDNPEDWGSGNEDDSNGGTDASL